MDDEGDAVAAKSKQEQRKKENQEISSRTLLIGLTCACAALTAKDPGRFRGTLNSAGEVVAIESSLTAPRPHATRRVRLRTL